MAKKTKKTTADSVTLVQDPFQIKTLEISHAQDEAEPELDEVFEDEAETDPKEDATLLEKLNQAIEEATAEHEAEARELVERALEQEAAAFDPEATLKAQIAEDEALNSALAEEAAAAEAALAMDPDLRAALPASAPQKDDTGAFNPLDLAELESCIEALLLMVDKPISIKRLQELLAFDGGPTLETEAFQAAVKRLQEKYEAPHHGFQVLEVAGGLQLRTKPARAALAKKLAKIQPHRLSSGGLETLALIAYKQPVMKEQIDEVRGVDSSYFIRGLLDRRLIQISGRSELPGRPLLYETTTEFLSVFGLKDLQALPPLQEIESMVPPSSAKADEDPRILKMRKLVGDMNLDRSVNLIYDPREDEKILAEIKERVSAIPTSTATLDEQREQEKLAKEGKLSPEAQAEALPPGTQLGLEAEIPPPVVVETVASPDSSQI